MDWEGYMSQADMDAVCATLRTGGCRSVHIGGGEPFMDFEGLLCLLKTAHNHGIVVEYVETNGYWATDEDKVKSYLQALTDAGADTLCISVDPFHAEYVPYARPVRLAELCGRYGFGCFLWQQRFLPMLSGVDATKAHSREALDAAVPDYVLKTAQAYGLRYGGRAINIEAEYMPVKPLEKLMAAKSPCRELLSTNHFHVDMYGRFIPPGCTGIAIPLDEMITGLEPGKYPAFEALISGGVAALVAFAQKKGFCPNSLGYTSACAMCFHVRHFLSKQECYPELVKEHYEQSLAHY